jgi:hypothetical protein
MANMPEASIPDRLVTDSSTGGSNQKFSEPQEVEKTARKEDGSGGVIAGLQQRLTSKEFYEEFSQTSVERKRLLRDTLKDALRYCETQMPPEVDLESVFSVTGYEHLRRLKARGIHTLDELELALATGALGPRTSRKIRWYVEDYYRGKRIENRETESHKV